jgi:thiol-disulfide isomerase/thioredoxin
MKLLVLCLISLLCAACQKTPDASVTGPATVSVAVGQAPVPGDPAYVAEEPRLTQLIGKPGPDITLQAIDGSVINLADAYGKKPVYLKLWASYCIPCRAQMPKLEKIYESVGDRIQVIAVNAGVGDDAAKATAFAAKIGIHMPIAIDDGSLGAWLKMQGTPVHLLLDRNGRIAFVGHQDGLALDAAIQQVLDDSPARNTATQAFRVQRMAALKIGDTVPQITLTSSDESNVTLQMGASGHPRALLFTSVWCESYLQEIEPKTAESCQRARSEVSQLVHSNDVQWLGVVTHMWTTPQDLADYQVKTKQKLPYAIDTEGTAFRLFGIQRFPAVALIDADGRLRRIVGPDDKDLTQAVTELTKQRQVI